MRDDRALTHEERSEAAPGELVAYFVAGAAFIVTRVVLIFRRPPDVDEVLAVSLAQKDLASIFSDSGAPLYYWILHAVNRFRPIDVQIARFISLAIALITLIVILRALRNRAEKILAALLLAVYPHHVYFSSSARPYALCALFIGIAAVALDRWAGSGDRRPMFPVTLSTLAAAYSHSYGAFFFPVPIFVAFLARDRVKVHRGVVASVVASLAFIPGFIVMAHHLTPAKAGATFASVLRIGFEGRLPILNDVVTSVARIISIVLLLLGLILTVRSRRATRFLTMFLVPIAGATALAAFGISTYLPFRFEVVLTVPVILWFVNATMQLAPLPRTALVVLALLLGAGATASIIIS